MVNKVNKSLLLDNISLPTQHPPDAALFIQSNSTLGERCSGGFPLCFLGFPWPFILALGSWQLAMTWLLVCFYCLYCPKFPSTRSALSSLLLSGRFYESIFNLCGAEAHRCVSHGADPWGRPLIHQLRVRPGEQGSPPKKRERSAMHVAEEGTHLPREILTDSETPCVNPNSSSITTTLEGGMKGRNEVFQMEYFGLVASR